MKAGFPCSACLSVSLPKKGISMSLPFEQQPKETAKAFEAFSLYLQLGPARSLAAVARKLGKSEGLIERWSRRHHWGERIDEHGKHMAALTRKAEVQVVNEFALERAKRNAAQEESEWQTRCELLALAREKIAEWRANPRKLGTLEGIARLLELASKLGRLSCGMATDKTERTVEETHTVSVDFELALKKIYGAPLPGEVVDVEGACARPLGPVVKEAP
jgi:hypothetical protein